MYRIICTNNEWNVSDRSARELSRIMVSHLVRFILGFRTQKSVPLSEISHLLSVPLSEVFITINWQTKILDWPKVSHLVRSLSEVLLH